MLTGLTAVQLTPTDDDASIDQDNVEIFPKPASLCLPPFLLLKYILSRKSARKFILCFMFNHTLGYLGTAVAPNLVFVGHTLACLSLFLL